MSKTQKVKRTEQRAYDGPNIGGTALQLANARTVLARYTELRLNYLLGRFRGGSKIDLVELDSREFRPRRKNAMARRAAGLPSFKRQRANELAERERLAAALRKAKAEAAALRKVESAAQPV